MPIGSRKERMEATSYTPFKLPLWSEWTVKVKGQGVQRCHKCASSILPLKSLTIQSLVKNLKQRNRLHDLPKLLVDNFVPSILYVDVACILFDAKQWIALRALVAHWPFESFQLSHIIPASCSACWLVFLESDDFEDPEKEGGDTERQLFRKVFKHVLDGYFIVVKKTLENEGQASPLRELDLTLDTSQDVRSFLWEEEFRRLGKRITKTLDVCILAGMHKKMQADKQLALRYKNFTVARQSTAEARMEANNSIEVENSRPDESSTSVDESTNPSSHETLFEISTWNDEFTVSNSSSIQNPINTDNQNDGEPNQQSGGIADIGVWNGNALDLSHLTHIPLFSIIIDASVSEKSNDILTWIQQRYDEFSPSPSPVSAVIRYLEVNLHEERKLEALLDRLPEHISGLKLSEICERRSAIRLASQLGRFTSVRCLDLGSCAFDLADHPHAVEHMSFALAQLPQLERLSLAHNRLENCLSSLLTPLQHGLVLLDLSSCNLSDDDLIYLGESSHLTTLRSLSLASNELGVRWNHLLSLVEKFGKGTSLRILDLSSNEFVESQLTVLSRATLGPLSSLSLFDLSWHELTFASLISIVELLASKTVLRIFCLSTPIDMVENGYSHPDCWQLFVDFTEKLTAKHREQQLRPPLTLHWCLM